MTETFNAVKRVIIGRPRASRELKHQLLPKWMALPVFSSAPMSSVAYATEEALLVLLAVSVSAAVLLTPISIAVAGVLAVTVLSYRLTVRAYSTSGGAYVVARDNLGDLAGLLAAAALLADYALTVAVSISAGVEAIASAVPALLPYVVAVSAGFVAAIALANLRGVREAGVLFAVPTYGFVIAMLALLGTGLVQCLGACPRAVVPEPEPVGPPLAAVGAFVILHAFASGSTALTGVEAVSNGVSAFREPRGRNAAAVLAILGVTAVTLFLGVSYLASAVGAAPSQSVTVLSEIARAVFGESVVFYLVQAFTFAILILAANTAFQGFPRLAALLGRDHYLPRQFEELGDRLVHSNGLVVLALAAGLLIWLFEANADQLIQLYIVGVFTAFTLSQAGMVRYWLKRRGERGEAARGWGWKAALNATGALATGVVLVIIVVTKFGAGAWIVVVAIPLLIGALAAISRHHRNVVDQLAPDASAGAEPAGQTVVLCVEDLDGPTLQALGYLRHLRGSDFRAVHVPTKGPAGDLKDRWSKACQEVELETLPSGDHPTSELLDFVRSLPEEEGFVTVVVPELVPRPSLPAALARPTSIALKAGLLEDPRVVVCDLASTEASSPGTLERLIPERSVAFAIVQNVDGAALRAVSYALGLGTDEVRAVHIGLHPEDIEPVQREWERRQMPVELEIVDAPLRHLGDPLLDLLRGVTDDPGALAAVVLPEIVPKRRWVDFIHNGRPLYLKWLLLFEPRVLLANVPFRLD